MIRVAANQLPLPSRRSLLAEEKQRRIEEKQRRIEAEERRIEEKQRRIEAEERANKEARLARWRVLAGTILTCGLLFLLQWALFGPGAAAALGVRAAAFVGAAKALH
ncbi:hypothetical protein HYH03_000964 [Edaphochlamys debaryana]|uniref:Uncharacterized protein n=1 Tax=Edaphochlamys debaryana TaxID=47281 RepID=A0A835YG60_9CHLO|nr:hypothetical protein HYH03_000964 [Edaphochlamys debaryana]|eukprot:KAG2501149.1 hypothetical protein HYH03_000964 [Edaphochlamys debaryana]